eukprot:Skav223691  [mRNA]  locus=scaffold1907:135136:136380:+ [translate_table: standard]
MPQAVTLDVPVELIKALLQLSTSHALVMPRWAGSSRMDSRGHQPLAKMAGHRHLCKAELGVLDLAQQRVLDSAVEPLRCFHHGDVETSMALHAIEGPVAGQIFFVGAGVPWPSLAGDQCSGAASFGVSVVHGEVSGGRHNASNGIVLSENYVYLSIRWKENSRNAWKCRI